jgi:hypothetical protein
MLARFLLVHVLFPAALGVAIMPHYTLVQIALPFFFLCDSSNRAKKDSGDSCMVIFSEQALIALRERA